MRNKQVVNTPKPQEITKPPKKANFLAEHNQKVDKETKSTLVDGKAPLISNKPVQSLGQNQPQKSMPSIRQKQQPPKLSKVQDKKLGDTKPKEIKSLNDADASDLLPSVADLRGMQAMPFNDYLENVEQDAQTHLNTWEFKYATFFNRIKEGVAQTWSPKEAILQYDPEGKIMGRQDRMTILRVTINNQGEIIRLKVSKESGAAFLDDEAQRAFKTAAPFLNPPKALFVDEKEFTFNFAFLVNIERGLSFDLNWQSD